MRSHLVVACIVIAAVTGGAACTTPREQLTLDGRVVTVFNDSGQAWKGVEVWVNHHYRVTRDSIAPDERFVAPLETFVAGFGQRFPREQPVTGIEVTGTDDEGRAVRLVWGEGRRK